VYFQNCATPSPDIVRISGTEHRRNRIAIADAETECLLWNWATPADLPPPRTVFNESVVAVLTGKAVS
jgi:hypothetical protein